jgi:heterodisulfide reductase subunit A-like polyferredoxin
MARIANCRVGFKPFLDEIRDDPRLTVTSGQGIAGVEKKDGRFTVGLSGGGIVEADRVVVATGLTPYDPVEYRSKRVLTSLDYDALIDQRMPELPADFNKVAFIPCVGSRSEEYPLCSSVCCSYTLREIKWTLARAKPEITVFYNDLRLFGQEFFMERILREGGVRFVRANSRSFEEEDGGVRLRWFAHGKIMEESFNCVVLAIGLRPNPALAGLSRLFGFSLNRWGFVAEHGALATDVEGVYAQAARSSDEHQGRHSHGLRRGRAGDGRAGQGVGRRTPLSRGAAGDRPAIRAFRPVPLLSRHGRCVA